MNRFYQLGGFLNDFMSFGANPATPGGMFSLGLNTLANNISTIRDDRYNNAYQQQWQRQHQRPSLVSNPFQYGNPNVMAYGGGVDPEYFKKGGIHINPANRGKFTATKKRTGKTTEELTHSKNPLTRKRAIFAQNARKWHHQDGGAVDADYQDWADGYGLYNDSDVTGYNPVFQYGGGFDVFLPAYAEGGGLSRKEDYGSKEKPYPSVASSDFAGGGRSYPIPTRADAVDALRLAGLHGRSDVKAKVYAKYPDLKKQYGGAMEDYSIPNYMIGGPIPFGYRISHQNGELYKAAEGGPIDSARVNMPVRNDAAAARAAKILQLSQMYGVPTNQIFTQTMRDQIDYSPNADVRYVQYQFQNPATGQYMTIREHNNKVKGTPKQKMGGYVKGQSYNLTPAQIKQLEAQGYELEY